MRLLKNRSGSAQAATVAQVTFSEGGEYGAVASTEKRGLPVFGPRGLAYRPCEGDNLLVIPADGADVCAGVLGRDSGLEPGELRLASSGGADIYLKANGDVVINGVVITKAGEIHPPGAASPQRGER